MFRVVWFIFLSFHLCTYSKMHILILLFTFFILRKAKTDAENIYGGFNFSETAMIFNFTKNMETC